MPIFRLLGRRRQIEQLEDLITKYSQQIRRLKYIEKSITRLSNDTKKIFNARLQRIQKGIKEPTLAEEVELLYNDLMKDIEQSDKLKADLPAIFDKANAQYSQAVKLAQEKRFQEAVEAFELAIDGLEKVYEVAKRVDEQLKDAVEKRLASTHQDLAIAKSNMAINLRRQAREQIQKDPEGSIDMLKSALTLLEDAHDLVKESPAAEELLEQIEQNIKQLSLEIESFSGVAEKQRIEDIISRSVDLEDKALQLREEGRLFESKETIYQAYAMLQEAKQITIKQNMKESMERITALVEKFQSFVKQLEKEITTAQAPARLQLESVTTAATKAYDYKATTSQLLSRRFRLIKSIGEGNFGSIELHEDMELKRPVAIKSLSQKLSNNPLIRKAFKREASFASQLKHPQIAQIHDVFVYEAADQLSYLVREFVNAKSIKQLLAEQGRLDLAKIKIIFLQICEILSHSHGQWVVHGGLKSSNIFINDELKVFITDFGLIETRISAIDQELKDGSISYYAPEAIKGHRSTDLADIYSIGVVLYETLTGSLPFTSKDKDGILLLKERMDFRVPSECATVRKEFDPVIISCMEFMPKKRYNNAAELKAAIEKIQ